MRSSPCFHRRSAFHLRGCTSQKVVPASEASTLVSCHDRGRPSGRPRTPSPARGLGQGGGGAPRRRPSRPPGPRYSVCLGYHQKIMLEIARVFHPYRLSLTVHRSEPHVRSYTRRACTRHDARCEPGVVSFSVRLWIVCGKGEAMTTIKRSAFTTPSADCSAVVAHYHSPPLPSCTHSTRTEELQRLLVRRLEVLECPLR